jgi:hypothetical protein
MSYGLVSLQGEDDDRTSAHEFDEAGEKWPLSMNCIEALGFCVTQMDLAHSEHGKPFVQDPL